MRHAVILLVLIANSALADAITIGPDGIDSKATELDGDRIEIGQIEGGRSGKPGYGTPPEPAASNTKPEEVYFRTLVAMPDEAETEHATLVAGVMIGDDTVGAGLFEGIAPKANLHSAAVGLSISDELDITIDDAFGLTADRLARISGADPNSEGQTRRMRAINMSATRPLQPIIEDTNGNSRMTLIVDWSARRHDVLYAVAWGNNDKPNKRAPTDNFNGMTIAASQQVDPDNGDTAYRRFGSINHTLGQPTDFRGAISLLAPGEPVQMLEPGDNPTERVGTSAAVPHVTGTVALLQQFAEPKVDAATDPLWGENSQKHEVMKAVMMNAADKLAGVHGSTRNVLDVNGNDWLQSAGHTDDLVPLDPWMGTGHLNAKRSLQQYQSGERDPDLPVPKIAWDYEGVGEQVEYNINGQIGGGYIAATLVWDRRINKTEPGNFMEGDTFDTGTPEQRLNNLDLYLMPVAAVDFADAVAKSTSPVQNVEHIFFDIPTPGFYKLVVHNNPIGGIGDFQNFALAWWFGNATAQPGDYDGNGSAGPEDYDAWRMNFGASVAAGTGADGSGNGIIDAADYVVWRDAMTAGSGSQVAVPEPAGLTLMIAAFGLTCWQTGCASRFSAKRNLSPVNYN